LDEVLTTVKVLQDKLATAEADRQAQLTIQLTEQGKWKEVAEARASDLAALKPKAEALDAIEATLKDVLASQIAELPEVFRALVPTEMTVQQQLGWIARNRAALLKPKPADIGVGANGGQAPIDGVTLSDEEKVFASAFGMKSEDYAKNKK
jgi:hypothetical protein